MSTTRRDFLKLAAGVVGVITTTSSTALAASLLEDVVSNDINPVKPTKFEPAKISYLDKMNILRLQNYLDKQILALLFHFRHEVNDKIMRDNVVCYTESLLNEIKCRSTMFPAFTIRCDESNNPPAVIDQNRLVVTVGFNYPIYDIHMVRDYHIE